MRSHLTEVNSESKRGRRVPYLLRPFPRSASWLIAEKRRVACPPSPRLVFILLSASSSRLPSPVPRSSSSHSRPPQLVFPLPSSAARSFELEKMEEANLEQCTQAENDEEYVLIDLENVCMQADIPTNAPYTLSGLDTLNPTLTIGNHLKLIGEYQETIGTCYMFCERDAERAVKNTEIGSCGGNFPKEQQHTGGLNQAPCKQISLVASTQKMLKFRLEADVQTENAV